MVETTLTHCTSGCSYGSHADLCQAHWVYTRGIDIVDITSATNIAGSKFDSHKNAVAPKGKLDKSVTPAVYTPFVSIVDQTQLARFGLHDGLFLSLADHDIA